jgi:hypothetical protein
LDLLERCARFLHSLHAIAHDDHDVSILFVS